MKATHRGTYLPDGESYLFHVTGDKFRWCSVVHAWSRDEYGGFERNYLGNEDWLVVKLSTFKGNK